MKRKTTLLVLNFIVAVWFSGCAGIIHELANDQAVVGMTGFWLALGAMPTPGGVPIPTISTGYGTLWRIGKHDNVIVKVNSEGDQGGAKAQLEINTSDNLSIPAPVMAPTTNP